MELIDSKVYFSEAVNHFLDNDLLCDFSGVRFRYSDIRNFAQSEFFKSLERKLVICKLTNDVECLALYFTLLVSGAVPLLTSTDLSELEYSTLLDAYQPAAELIKITDTKVQKKRFSNTLFENFTVYSSEKPSCSYSLHDDLALLLPTSGSTGSVKYVRISHKNLISNTKTISEYLKINEMDKVITTLPPNYSYGASVLHTHFINGSSVVVTEATFFESEFWNFLEKSEVTTLNGVPFHFEILHRLKFHEKKFPYLRVITQAGGKLKAEIKSYFFDYCLKNTISFFVMYGQTEASPRMSYITFPDLLEAPESIGQGLTDCKLFLKNEENQEINIPNVAGELHANGNNIAMGYAYSYLDLSNNDEFQGTLGTGDIAYFDNQKRFFIVGRSSRFVKIFGNRISLDDVQNYVNELGFESVCTGNDFFIKVGCINISISEKKILKKKLMGKLNISGNVIKIFYLKKIDRTSSGKIAYSEIDKKMKASL